MLLAHEQMLSVTAYTHQLCRLHRHMGKTKHLISAHENQG